MVRSAVDRVMKKIPRWLQNFCALHGLTVVITEGNDSYYVSRSSDGRFICDRFISRGDAELKEIIREDYERVSSRFP